MSFAGCKSDASLGPAVQGCRGDFDFTLKFEKLFLSILPTAIFLAISLPRLIYLCRRPIIVKGSVLRGIKSVFLIAYLILQLALLGVTIAKSTKLRDLFISSSTLVLLSALCMLVLSDLEHARSARPSILLNSYLFLTILFDVVQIRTLWLASTTHDETVITQLMTAALALKAVISFLESQHKTKWLQLDRKSQSPEETTGIYGLGAYLWLNRLFFEGWRKVITMADLYPLDMSMSAEGLEERLSSILCDCQYRGKKFGLGRALFKAMTVAFLIPVGPRIALIGFTFCQPFLINSVLSYLEEPADARDKNVGYGLIGATVLIYLGVALSEALYWYFHERSMWMTRGALASAIYKKSTRAKLNVADDSAALTLMSTDVERIRQGMLDLHEAWANILEIAIASFLLYRSLGVAFLAPIIVVLACAMIVAAIATITSQRQKDWMQKIESRVGMTANVIANMKHLRISGLALPIQRIIQNLRLEELRVGSRFRMVLCWSVVLAHAPYYLAPVFTFAWTSETLTVTRIFTSFSYLTLLCTPLTGLFQSVPSVLAAVACLDRIQTFLDTDSREDFRVEPPRSFSEKRSIQGDASSPRVDTNPVVTILNGNFGWEEDRTSLSNMNLAIPPRQLTMVVGPIASGKSTLCKVLLGEAPVFNGQVILGPSCRRVGYCDQNPFLSNASIKQNILGFAPFDQTRYNEVIEASMLQIDLETLPQGDDTKIGSNGISLSGGQKQRVSIARALYLETDFFVFDDVLSGLDADTEEHVFSRVFGPEGLIKRRNATAVLCTHSIRHLPSADHIVAMGSDGTIVEQGKFVDLVANQKYVHSLGVKAKSLDSGSQTSKTSIEMEQLGPDPLLRAKSATEVNAVTKEQDASRMNGDRTVYKHYMQSIGFWPIPFFFLTGIATGFFHNWMTVWIDLWSEGISATIPTHSSAFYLGLFALFQASCLMFMFLNVWICLKWIINRSGSTLHKAALQTVINAPLQFFTKTDTGVVTNLFSQDMTLIDGELPIALINILLDGFMCLGMAAVVASSAPYLAIIYPFLGFVLWVIQKFYLKTSRQLRLLDLEAKSPLYTNFLDTMKGLATFRAFGWVDDSIAKNNHLLDNSQRPAYLLAMIQRWLTFVLNCVVTVLAVVIVTMATRLSSNTGLTGASLVTLMNFGSSLAFLIRYYTILETSLGAVNRLKTFSDNVKSESRKGEDVEPDESWPQRGEITIDGVSASYGDMSGSESGGDDESKRSDADKARNLALRNLNITIASGEKVAICGRSGSGKSSTLLLLLRLLEPVPSTAQHIRIDGTPLHQINRHTLRQRIIAVPQDSVFLPDGSAFKDNLDPLGISSDLECQSVLETVGLGGFVRDRGGLSAGMTADTLSQGQKQLFSLGRAILRRRVRSREVARGAEGGLLLLDEVSSSVDVETDRLMQGIIQREFAGYTMVMVSHRLDMVMDFFDRVLVMDKGAVAETGSPRALVETEGSRFRELWEVSNTGRGDLTT